MAYTDDDGMPWHMLMACHFTMVGRGMEEGKNAHKRLVMCHWSSHAEVVNRQVACGGKKVMNDVDSGCIACLIT